MPEAFDVVRSLRQATQDLHARLEQSCVFSRLMQADVTVDDYVRALGALHRSYSTFEPRMIQGLQRIDRHYDYRGRLPLLQRDLTRLGVAPQATEVTPALAPPCSRPATLALLYVVEGSSLGGQLVMRQLQARLGPAVTGAMAFYALDGGLEKQPWRQAQALLRSQLSNAQESASTLIEARKVFELFIAQAGNPLST
jgi:heme oxygenase